MKQTFPYITLSFVFFLFLSGCDLAEGILKLGFWSGVIIVGLVVVIGAIIFSRFRR